MASPLPATLWFAFSGQEIKMREMKSTLNVMVMAFGFAGALLAALIVGTL